VKRKDNQIPFFSSMKLLLSDPCIDRNLITLYRTCVVLSSDEWIHYTMKEFHKLNKFILFYDRQKFTN
jgi:hypothetical protein